MNLSDVDDEDARSTHDQLAEFLVGGFGSDGVYYTQYEESFDRDEDDVKINDDAEVQSLIESESEASACCVTDEPDVVPSTNGGQRCTSDKTTTAQEIFCGVTT